MIARNLLKMYGSEDGVMLDPFVGSGTTLAEAKLYGMRSIGFDLNPLALLVSKLKSHKFNHNELDNYLLLLEDLIPKTKLQSFKKSATYLNLSPDVAMTWYTKRTLRELAMLLRLIKSQEQNMLQNLGMIIIGQLLRKMSFQRPREAKKYRKEGWQDFSGEDTYVPVIPKFYERLVYVIQSMKDYADLLPKNPVESKCYLFDSSSSNEYPDSLEVIDLVITSPPYGDSPTTVAYEQQSWFANNGLGLDTRPDSALAREMLGGGKDVEPIESFGYRTIDSILKKMPEETRIKNSKFLNEYYSSICNVSKRVVNNGVVCYIVGNRSWRGSGGKRLRLDLFTKWAFERNGFKLIGKIIERDVINKSQPSKSSNDGKSEGSGEVGESMNKEYIVRLRKIC
jgi:DNA modification methylase